MSVMTTAEGKGPVLSPPPLDWDTWSPTQRESSGAGQGLSWTAWMFTWTSATSPPTATAMFAHRLTCLLLRPVCPAALTQAAMALPPLAVKARLLCEGLPRVVELVCSASISAPITTTLPPLARALLRNWLAGCY